MMDYRLLRSRRKTLAIEITPRGELLVRAPLRLSKKEIEKFLVSRADWIEAHLARLPAVTPLTQSEHAALIRTAKDVLPGKVRFYAERIGVTYGRISVRSQHSRWGSCSAAGNLNFNCLLMLAPEPVQDYVVVHELCHRKEMNHSPRFWTEVESILPGFRMQKKWLKENGSALLSRLPDAQK